MSDQATSRCDYDNIPGPDLSKIYLNNPELPV